MITNSIRFKATVLYSSILCAILIGFSFYLFHSVKRILYQNLDEELILRAEQIVGTIGAYGEITGGKMPAMSLMRQFLSDDGEVPLGQGAMDKLWEKHRFSMGVHNDFFRIVDINGTVLLQSEDLPSGSGYIFDRQLLGKRQGGIFSNIQLTSGLYRELNYPFTFNYRRPLLLQLAMPLSSVQRSLGRLLMIIFSGISGILVMSLFIGSFLTRKILRPVTQVTEVANNISQRNLSVRIPEKALDAEMRLLVDSFNQMIDRLDKSFAHINEFSSHVAHELKTPLAIIKGELELALMRKDVGATDRQVMGVVLQEIDRMIRIIKDLLLIARFDYRQDIFKMATMDLKGFLEDVCAHAGVLAAEKGIRLQLQLPGVPLLIQGDVVHLRRLFFNLIHNAVKFTSDQGEIIVAVKTDGQELQVAVKDTGEGIALEDQGRIFEKFYRGRQLGKSESPGTGLGLSLARSIARAHQGDIVFESKPHQGTTFTVTLPLLSDDKRLSS